MENIKRIIESHIPSKAVLLSCKFNEHSSFLKIIIDSIEDISVNDTAVLAREIKNDEYIVTNLYSPLNRNRSFYIQDYSFNLNKLNEIASIIIGKHDFSTFCKQTSLKENNQCEITYSKWKAEENKLYYNIKGNRFLHHMVRYLVGTMINVSSKQNSISAFESLFFEKKICNSIIKAPAQGLYLSKIIYE